MMLMLEKRPQGYAISDECGRFWGVSLFKKNWQKILSSYLKKDCLILGSSFSNENSFENSEKIQFKEGYYFLPKRMYRQIKNERNSFESYLEVIRNEK